MIRQFYFDTSVFGRVFDSEFEKETVILFQNVALGKIKCIYSDLTENELASAPQRVKNFFTDLREDHKKLVMLTPQALKLAKTYIAENVVGETSLDDCIHIAVATLNKADALISWNFRHIVNNYRIRGYIQ